MKRKAPYDINQDHPEGLEDDDANQHEEVDIGKISTPQEIAQRKILKIKGPKTHDSTEGMGEVKFQINPSFGAESDKRPDSANKEFSFLSNKDTSN